MAAPGPVPKGLWLRPGQARRWPTLARLIHRPSFRVVVATSSDLARRVSRLISRANSLASVETVQFSGDPDDAAFRSRLTRSSIS